MEALHGPGISQKKIAQQLGVDPSTLSREFKRHGAPEGYNAGRADRLCRVRRMTATRAHKRKDGGEVHPFAVVRVFLSGAFGLFRQHTPGFRHMLKAKDFYEHGLALLVSETSGEIMVESYARLAGEQRVCIPCHERITAIREPRSVA